ncbi:MAG TPA: hypothetical protein VF503_15850 [Sphingobium sp.]|uniref:hypothetical protein n=1 Tax=Sphingobium sp. TaxID=1912891 RepID=UPI002ED0FEE9
MPRIASRRAWAVNWLGLWLVLAALVSQGFVQSHVHGTTAPAVGKHIQGSATVARQAWERASVSDECPLCQELSLDGLWLAPPGVELAAPTVSSFVDAIIVTAALVRVRPSHDWRSRAPPAARRT